MATATPDHNARTDKLAHPRIRSVKAFPLRSALQRYKIPAESVTLACANHGRKVDVGLNGNEQHGSVKLAMKRTQTKAIALIVVLQMGMPPFPG